MTAGKEKLSTTDPGDQPSRLGGTLIAHMLEKRTRSIAEFVSRLADSGLAESARSSSFRAAFGGDLNMTPAYQLAPAAWRQHRYRADLHGRIPYVNGFSTVWETGANVGDLVTNRPFDRHKFYLSLDLSSPDKEARAQRFIAEVYAGAAKQGLSMLTKSEIHNYDSCDLYTWEPQQMASVLGSAYARHPDIWLSVEHPLQGPVGSVDPRHIGVVQEPIGGLDGQSHSNRMAALGGFIDQQGGSLDPATWTQGCAQVGVQPDAPWLIDPALRQSYESARNAHTSISVS